MLTFMFVRLCFGICRSIWRMSKRRKVQLLLANRRMKGREPISHEAYGECFVSQHARPVAARVRAIVESIVGIDLKRARSEDHLIKHLGLGRVDGLDGAFLQFDLQREFGITLDRNFLLEARTLGQLVQLVASLVSRQRLLLT